ncbi:MAG: hypothetical protein KF823_12605 [Xanthomonadales bacterium]|nr:hypothetical protein [Xanthomonadales bacterium]
MTQLPQNTPRAGPVRDRGRPPWQRTDLSVAARFALAMAIGIADAGSAVAGAPESATGAAGHTGSVSVLGIEFRGDRTPFEFASSLDSGALWCTGAISVAEARLALPAGARLLEMRVWGTDDLPSHGLRVSLVESCLPNLLPAATPVNTVLGLLESVGSPLHYNQALSFDPAPVVDGRDCTYWVRAQFAPLCAGGGSLAVRKVRVRYQR